MRLPLLFRAVAIAGVAAALLVPIARIEGKINERSARAEGVLSQFAADSTNSQIVAGPFLALTCEETYMEEREIKRDGKAETISERKTRSCPTGYFPPRTLSVSGRVPVESLHRGIYPIRVYRATLDIAGELDWPGVAASRGAASRAWKKAYLVIAVSDPRGIKKASTTGEGTLARSSDDALAGFAIQEELGDYAARKEGAAVPFGLNVELAGTSALHIAPVGDATEIRLSSDWPHPSFNGGWTPDERTIGAQGFRAEWRTTHLATGGQAYWEKLAREGKLENANTAGLSLFDPVNIYSLSYRATEYGFLFILFTFSALALLEVLAGIRIHPIQYALVGSAIAVFFLLLIALSEHIAFIHAYAGAAAACVLLIAVYLRHPLGSNMRTLAMATLLSALYAGLYVLLNSEDHALLLGSLMVFVLLAVTMVATRKLDWGEMSRRLASKATMPKPQPSA